MQNYHYFTIYNNINVDYNNTDVEKHIKHASALTSTSARCIIFERSKIYKRALVD